MEYEIESEGVADPDNPSQNDQIDKSIENQSTVTPEDYPAWEREGQVAVVIPEEEKNPARQR